MQSRVASTLSNPPARKRYVTRACDACRKRKSKCDGLDPCSRCISGQIQCTYDMPYTRGQLAKLGCEPVNTSATRGESGPSPQAIASPMADSSLLLSPAASDQNFSQAYQDEDASIGTFLRRALDHLSQAGRGLPRSLFGCNEEEHYNRNRGYACILPEKAVAKGYIDCYFEHASTTYRFILVDKIMRHFNQVYEEVDGAIQDDAKMAKLLFIMGIGCIWTASWRKEPLQPWKDKAYRLLYAAQARLQCVPESFCPSIELLQVHVLKCQLELYAGRFNSAWLTLGLAIRLGQMINIQKKPTSTSALDRHMRIALFWAMYMMDRYLSVTLGRPAAIRDDDVTVPLCGDVELESRPYIDSREKKLWVGVVAHVRLTQIIGHIMTSLYAATGLTLSTAESDKAVADIETELAVWRRETPVFFHPKVDNQTDFDETFYDVPWIFQRQQRTVQGAFLFAHMLLYRGYLLNELLQQEPNSCRQVSCPDKVRECIDNAMAMLGLAAGLGIEECKYNSTFWISRHFIYCAVSILVVYLGLYQETGEMSTIKASVEWAMETHLKSSESDTTPGAGCITAPSETPEPTGKQFDDWRPGEVAAYHDTVTQTFVNGDGSGLSGSFDNYQDRTDFMPFCASGDLDMIMEIGFDTMPLGTNIDAGGVVEVQKWS